jgi:hypothetical protein
MCASAGNPEEGNSRIQSLRHMPSHVTSGQPSKVKQGCKCQKRPKDKCAKDC